ncbi:MAG TPA: amidase family protein, partial [Polyangiaceae bacterium]|nr:amidase family protein [Polyangiaceae bacterium]
MTDNITALTARDLSRLYRQRELSPTEVARSVLARIEQARHLNAFVASSPEQVLASAAASSERWRAGAPLSQLDGVPVSVKDLLPQRGLPTRRGSKTVSPDGPWLEDAPAVARLREAGALLLGKTATSEFGLKGLGDSPVAGITRNPWQLEHTPGGSSAGAVAAVAAGLGPLAVGTDGGGSIRVPSAFSGVVGFKPTFGVVPNQSPHFIGVPPHVGPIAHDVQDLIALFDVLRLPDARDPFSARASMAPPDTLQQLRQLKIAATKTLGFARISSDVERAFDAALASLRELGLNVIDTPLDWPPAAPTIRTLFQARAAHTVQPLSAQQRELLDPAILASARRGEAFSALDYLRAEAERVQLVERSAAFHTNYDLLLTPTIADVAPRIDAVDALGELSQRAPFAGLFSLTRQPALSIPIAISSEGLPL